MPAALKLDGLRFGRLVVIERAGSSSGRSKWACKCDCGTHLTLRSIALTGGHNRSCGCLRRDITRKRATTHGKAGTPTYKIWKGLKKRCLNKNEPSWNNYGGRGIRVCARWLKSFEAFLSDMGPRPPRMTIERKNNERGYYPWNCRWATRTEQGRNQRTNRHITANGKRKLLCEWAVQSGIHPNTIRARLRLGWSPDNAVTKPARKMTKKQTHLT